MVDTTVYFATNRLPDPGAPGGFGNNRTNDPAEILYAALPITKTTISSASSGRLGVLAAPRQGGFSPAQRTAMIQPGKNLLVFIHGFANSYTDAVKRAAFVRAFYAASDRAGADTTVIAYSWPSAGDVVGELSNPTAAYREDRVRAAQSGPCVAAFLREALGIAKAQKQRFADARVFLLAHSMGNHALNSAIGPFLAAGAPPTLFDEVILAAADTFDTALETQDHSGLFRLREMAKRISVYSSHADAILRLLSFPINGHRPLGLDGAPSEMNAALYPPDTFRSIDCSDIWDLTDTDHSIAVDSSHQYYRRSACVRNDIAALMAGDPVAPGISFLATPAPQTGGGDGSG